MSVLCSVSFVLEAYRILVPLLEIEFGPLALEGEVSTTGPLGKSLLLTFNIINCLCSQYIFMRLFLGLCTLICIASPISYSFSFFPLWRSAHGDTSCSPFGFPFWLSHLDHMSQGLLASDCTLTSPMGSILPFPWTCQTSNLSHALVFSSCPPLA